jgi:hypothetical protein
MTLSTSSPSWKVASNYLTASKPGDIDTVQKHPIGTIRVFKDASLGEGEFIYLKGVASTVAGDAVAWNAGTGLTVRATVTQSVPDAIAFATAATVDATWGWYQISGQCLANKTVTVSLVAGIGVSISTTALVIHSSSLEELQGAWVSLISSASTAINGGKVQLGIMRPHRQGRIT